MERNHIIGFISIFAILMVWTILSKPSDAEIAQAKARRDSIARLNTVVDTFNNTTIIPPDSITVSSNDTSSTIIKEEIISLENDFI